MTLSIPNPHSSILNARFMSYAQYLKAIGGGDGADGGSVRARCAAALRRDARRRRAGTRTRRPPDRVAREADVAVGTARFRRRGQRTPVPAGARRRRRPLPVVLPSYGGARHQPNLLPLLALLLQRFGVPVLVHGTLHGNGRIATAYYSRELGIMPCANLVQAQEALDGGGTGFCADRRAGAGACRIAGAARPAGRAHVAHFGGEPAGSVRERQPARGRCFA